ncbi:WAT1-related protein At2g39510 [Cynara cardunculus var. scolymus]|uniref:WAT1-related protein At2g39510 n=1 Tax=Cynara cardunculus var. scolymus TaxID=59895 RepID=UPI000D62C1B3|nr:WAT1-related protein At2g39510 [Cynara cardunculus var. scolymus]
MSRDPWLRSADRLKPYLGVLFLQLGYAFNGIIVKSALNKGLNPCTFSVYRNIAAVIAFGPFALYFERKLRPQMTLSVFLKIMLLAQLEPVMDQILYYTGMKYTTVTFAIAMCNILPALTFFMAWIFRLEKVNIRRLHSQGKIIGTFVTVGGAMVMTLVNGPPIPLPWTNLSRVHHPRASEEPSQADHLKGAIMITAGCFFWASFYILQAVTLKKYPAQLSLTTLICTMGALQGTVMTLVIEKGKTGIWSIKWDTKLLATLYSGIVRSGASYYISGLVMKEKGPFFVTAFNPLGMVIVVIVSSFTLGEQMDLGRVVGAIIIVIGLYLIIWGKSKDKSLSDSRNEEVEMHDDEGARPNKNVIKSEIEDGIVKEEVDGE